MPSFGTESEQNLVGVDAQLVNVCRLAILVLDFKVIDGVRTIEEQRVNVARGKSWTMDSKHLPTGTPPVAHAVDLAPWPINWQDTEMFCVLAGVMFAAAHTLGVKLRWGGDWNQNASTRDERSRDYGHFEVVDP